MAGLAAIGALAAYFSQKEELENARHGEKEAKARAARRDFEFTFFNLLALFRDTTKEIEVVDQYGGDPLRGRDAIERILGEKIGHPKDSIEEQSLAYKQVYSRHQDDLGHYFRILYQIVRFIDESDIEEKAVYVRVARASLSNAEIVLLALNCIYGEGKAKFKPLVERHALLHNISESDARRWKLIGEFDDKAFGDRKAMIDRLRN